MINDGMQEMLESVNDADKVLIGIGEEFQYDWGVLVQDHRYQEIEAEIGEDNTYFWITPFLQKMVLRQSLQDKWKVAYGKLKKLLEGKDYFIISLCMDDYIYKVGMDEERIVAPCGGFRKMQCDQNCSHVLADIPEDSYEAVLRYYRKELLLEMLREPVCENCGAALRFNQLGVTKYAEEGYLGSWNRYTKWLQKTVNTKLCVVELGVGMEYPTVVRFPFEKVVFYNQKAMLYRIHSQLYQVGEEISGRGKGIQENALKFVCDI